MSELRKFKVANLCLCTDPQNRTLWGILSAEIGGGNGLEPLAMAARISLPVVDADYMGRAFPELQVGSASSAYMRENKFHASRLLVGAACRPGPCMLFHGAVAPLLQLRDDTCALTCAGHAHAMINGRLIIACADDDLGNIWQLHHASSLVR